jgi:hypothetical protein
VSSRVNLFDLNLFSFLSIGIANMKELFQSNKKQLPLKSGE